MTIMTKDAYRAAFAQAKADQEQLAERRANLQSQLDETTADLFKVRRALVSLSALAGSEADISDIGLTEACRSVLADAEKPLTTHDVMQGIEALGFDLSTQKNPAASVLAVLIRLTKENVKRSKTRRSIGGIPRIQTAWIGPKALRGLAKPIAKAHAPASSRR